MKPLFSVLINFITKAPCHHSQGCVVFWCHSGCFLQLSLNHWGEKKMQLHLSMQKTLWHISWAFWDYSSLECRFQKCSLRPFLLLWQYPGQKTYDHTGELLPEIQKSLASNQQIVASISNNQFFVPVCLPSISTLFLIMIYCHYVFVLFA